LDFTLKKHESLIETLQKQGFSFQKVTDFIKNPEKKVIILRHDVDKLPENSLTFARKEKAAGVLGTYYFRTVPESLDPTIIKEIASLGHEIGYHYEDVNLAFLSKKAKWKFQNKNETDFEKELVDTAIIGFEKNLNTMRAIVPVETICMHGRPMSRWDSRLLWKYYDYHEFGITAEPYFDVDFNRVYYLTDTGRRWDGSYFNIRDKVNNYKVQRAITKNEEFRNAPSPSLPLSYSFHSTFDIIKAAENNSLPDKIMLTFHPQRWTDRPLPWIKELIWQNLKNIVKYFIIKYRNR
jgi:hypothetical protein